MLLQNFKSRLLSEVRGGGGVQTGCRAWRQTFLACAHACAPLALALYAQSYENRHQIIHAWLECPNMEIKHATFLMRLSKGLPARYTIGSQTGVSGPPGEGGVTKIIGSE